MPKYTVKTHNNASPGHCIDAADAFWAMDFYFRNYFYPRDPEDSFGNTVLEVTEEGKPTRIFEVEWSACTTYGIECAAEKVEENK